MSKQHRIVRSEDATTVIISGDRRNPEPTHLIVKLPGGFVEIARTSDGSYWIHTQRLVQTCDEINEKAGVIAGSRIDWSPEVAALRSIPELPEQSEIRGLSVRIAVAA